MIHDPDLTDRLSGFPTESFADDVFRATRKSLDPLAFSSRGGRWAPSGEVSVLYTSLIREGALAEIAFHWGQLTPLPSKPAMLHRLRVSTRRTLRLIRGNLPMLGVDLARFGDLNYRRTQEIGAVVAFLGCDGPIAPSARWNCDNLVLFNDNLAGDGELSMIASESVDWRAWARSQDMLGSAGLE